jgi:glutathione reductase (NADPH)
VEVGGEQITCRYILVATGGKPFVPDIPGVEHAITSNEAFHLEHLPRDIVIVGGGYIAGEFAGIFKGLGSEVTLVHRREHLLRGFDEDVREAVTEDLEKRGIKLRLSSEVVAIHQDPHGPLQLDMKDGSRLETAVVMYATGRRPNTSNLGLESAGVDLGESGEVVVDDYSKSSVDSIYAVGDVTDRVNLTPVAIREGHAFADTLFGNMPTKVDHENIPTAVFSQPPVGVVGLTEHEARECCGKVDVYRTEFRPLRKTLGSSTEKVLMKLLVDCATDRVVGLHMVGKDAPEIVQMAAIAIKVGATKADFDNTIALHPTTSEEFVLMRTKYERPLPQS